MNELEMKKRDQDPQLLQATLLIPKLMEWIFQILLSQFNKTQEIEAFLKSK